MSLDRPPASAPGTPVEVVVPAGTVTVRVHTDHPADAFNPTPQSTALRGGRFDSVDGSYAYTYLGDGPSGAIAETLMRDLPLSGAPRELRLGALEGRRLSRVRVVRPLAVLDLCGPALTHVGASLALTKCEPVEYLATRAWATTLRTWLPHVAGFKYRPRHDENAIAYVLFDDGPDSQHPRAHGALEAMGEPGLALTSVQGLKVLRAVSRRHNATVTYDVPPTPARTRLLL